VRRSGVTLAVLVTLILPGTAAADTVLSPTRTDDPAGAGNCPTDCSLRQALASLAASGGTVQLGSGTYALSQRPLSIAGDVTIAGAGPAATAISAQGASGVIDVPSGATLILSQLTLTGGASGGAAGGALLNAGTSTLEGVEVTASTATSSPGVPAAGGGIANESGAALLLVGSSVTGDSASDGGSEGAFGGGIASAGNLNVINSTVAGDGASSSGGDGDGGGIAVTGGTATLSSDTLIDNTASGGTAAGGNLYAENGTIELRDTLAALGQSSGSAFDCAGSIVSEGWNLSDTAQCDLTALGDQPSIVPAILPLQDTGGLYTARPSAYSPAVDAGDPRGCDAISGQPVTTDELGAPRGQPCDIGALESVYPPVFETPPALEGDPEVNGYLDCDEPLIIGAQPISVAFQWLRSGAPIPGANGVEHTVTTGDGGHSLACELIATNPDGRATSTSAPWAIPAASTATKTTTKQSPFAGVTLASRTLMVGGGRVTLELRCPADSGGCSGRAALFSSARVARRTRWAAGTFTIATGRQKTARLHLGAAVRRRVRARHGVGLVASVTVSARNKAGTARALVYKVHLRTRRRTR
jgi:hypothetical protein